MSVHEVSLVHKRRGNILITAIFIAVFLFFLAVALVTTNRQHISLILSVDHRLRAQLAARAGLNRALEELDERGPARLTSLSETLESGASYHILWTPRLSQAGFFYELRSVGSSSFMREDLACLINEIKLSNNPDLILFNPAAPRGGDVSSGTAGNRSGTLWGLYPDFRWRVAVANFRAIPESLAGSGGRVFCACEAGDNPQIQDWQPTKDSSGFTQAGNFTKTADQIPGQHILCQELQPLEGTLFHGVDLPDPAEQLGNVTQPLIDGKENGTPRIETLSGNLQVDVSEYRGPVLNDYVIHGSLLAASDKSLFCFARHHFYQGSVFQNKPALNGSQWINQGTSQEGTLYSADALLKYDAAGNWTVLWDELQVSEKLTDPYLAGGLKPDLEQLVAAESQDKVTVHAFLKGDKSKILSLEKEGWRIASENPSGKPWLAWWGGLVIPRPFPLGELGPTVYLPGAISMEGMMPANHPLMAVNVSDLDPKSPYQTLEAEVQHYYPGVVANNPRSSCWSGQDLFVFGETRWLGRLDPREKKLEPGQLGPYLAHYNGQWWDVWPRGAAQLFRSGPSLRTPDQEINDKVIAVGSFRTSILPRAKYGVVGYLP